MKKIFAYKNIVSLLVILLLGGCKEMFNESDIKTNPNAVTDVDVATLLSGTLVGVAELHEDTDVRISAIWAGALNGLSRQHQGYADYIVSAQNFSWDPLYPVAGQARLIQTKADAVGDKWTKGVGQILEALLIAKATDLYGDVPYSQAFDDEKYPTPIFDKQADVYTALHATLDDAIKNLAATAGLSFSKQDFIYGGNVSKWTKVAYTLKARLYLHTGDYTKAIANATLGINSISGDALIPHGTSQGIDANLNYVFFKLNRPGDTGFDNAYIPTILQSRIGSVNTKTDETALYNHFITVGITGTGSLDPNVVDGAYTIDAPHPLLTYYETELIIAESQARLGSNDKALAALNLVRSNLANGYMNGKTFAVAGRKYDAYVLDDFGTAGLANITHKTTVQTALLYEIISQRYIAFLMQYEAFNDIRRLEKAQPMVQLPIPLYAGAKKPERYIYPQSEINTNPNVPKPVLDQFQKLPIYQ